MTLWTLKDAEGQRGKQSDTPPQGGHTTEPETLGDQRPLRGRPRNLVWHHPHSPYQLVGPQDCRVLACPKAQACWAVQIQIHHQEQVLGGGHAGLVGVVI